MKAIILSDVHGNLESVKALELYLDKHPEINDLIMLGDIIDYGMHSNEVIRTVKTFPLNVLCNIRGNHEQAVITDDYTRFSSERGRQCARYTKKMLSIEAWEYITNDMSASGKKEFLLGSRKCLAVHGSLKDVFWKSIFPSSDLTEYIEYDYVFSGHSHLPHFFEKYYDVNDPEHRNKKKTIFINPGSLGQPRNMNPLAQFAVLDTDTEEISMKKLNYNIKKEQEAYTGQVDDFYKIRLERGI